MGFRQGGPGLSELRCERIEFANPYLDAIPSQPRLRQLLLRPGHSRAGLRGLIVRRLKGQIALLCPLAGHGPPGQKTLHAQGVFLGLPLDRVSLGQNRLRLSARRFGRLDVERDFLAQKLQRHSRGQHLFL